MDDVYTVDFLIRRVVDIRTPGRGGLNKRQSHVQAIRNFRYWKDFWCNHAMDFTLVVYVTKLI